MEEMDLAKPRINEHTMETMKHDENDENDDDDDDDDDDIVIIAVVAIIIVFFCDGDSGNLALHILIFASRRASLRCGHPPFESAYPMQIYAKVTKGISKAWQRLRYSKSNNLLLKGTDFGLKVLDEFRETRWILLVFHGFPGAFPFDMQRPLQEPDRGVQSRR
jgi:hypothetical protein